MGLASYMAGQLNDSSIMRLTRCGVNYIFGYAALGGWLANNGLGGQLALWQVYSASYIIIHN